MPYDVDLAERIRRLLDAEPDISERKMFGGLAFLIGGNVAVAASGHGGLMVRANHDRAHELIDAGRGRALEMRGQPMRGWLLVDGADARTARQLARWVELGVAFARSLPPKASRPQRR